MYKSGFSVLSTASNQDHVLNIDSGIFQKDSKYERHVLDPVMYGRIKKQILKNVGSQQIFENMMDFTYIHDHYKVKYYEFVLSLVYLECIEKLITIKSWFGSHVVISKKESAIKPILSNVDIDTHHFDVSLSFPGESRGYVLELVKELHLKLGEGKYFYDHTYQAQLARPDLDNLLQEIYGKRTKLVVVFLSKNYDNKPWCGLEFRAIKELIMEKQAKKVMLVKVGDGDVKGIMKGDGYIDAEKTPPNLLSKYIQERLATL
jgi:hypothetical protein